MARAGRKDRGLLSRTDTAGKKAWYFRLWHEGRERRFGSFPTKTKAREFYEKAKLEQQEGRFFPERYHHQHHVLVEDVLARHLETSTVKNQAVERGYMRWWTTRLKGLRLNHITPGVIEEAQRDLLASNMPLKPCCIISRRSGTCSTGLSVTDTWIAIPSPACNS